MRELEVIQAFALRWHQNRGGAWLRVCLSISLINEALKFSN